MYKRAEQRWLKHLDFILLDMLSCQVAFILAFGVRSGLLQTGKWRWVYAAPDYLSLALWLALFSPAIAVIFNTMHDVLKRRWTVELWKTVEQSSLVFGATVVYLFSVKDSQVYSRITLWVTLILYCVLAYWTRMAWKRLLRRRRQHRENSRAVLLIADEASAAETVRRFKSAAIENINPCGLVLVNRDATGERIEGVDVVSGMEGAAQYICREWIDEVFFGVSNDDPALQDLIDKCRQMGVTIHMQVAFMGSGKQTVEKIAGIQVITNSINMATPFQLMLKRLIDILGGLALSVAALLAILIFGPIIKRKSPGPILYKQERIGQNGKRFSMYKLRSMYMDADARKQELMTQNRVAGGMMFKLDFDPRIIGNEILPDGTRKTGIGEFIRKTSIDETPQGFNILLNQMSLVGTRPPTVDEWEKYELHHRARLAVKPGLTGMWQVSGRSDITDFEEITRLDTEYIENWSIGLDLKLLFKTVGIVLTHRGAM